MAIHGVDQISDIIIQWIADYHALRAPGEAGDQPHKMPERAKVTGRPPGSPPHALRLSDLNSYASVLVDNSDVISAIFAVLDNHRYHEEVGTLEEAPLCPSARAIN